MGDGAVEEAVRAAVSAARGHFRYESGHHGDLWLDLDELLVDARRVRDWATELARRAVGCRPDIVCGPLTGGAFVAQFVAAELGIGFAYAERLKSETAAVRYRIAEPLRAIVRGKRVLLADDAVNAGSALTATLTDLREHGAEPVGFASLLALGDAATRMARQHGAPFFTILSLARELWSPEECPLCRAAAPLVDRVAEP
ncbi:MAG TPA: phosphoribosyltransferase [Candidatus Angelobacter sp.]|nr:phosphoribosyltransferase [Candidatus Angelobacter sp.]